MSAKALSADERIAELTAALEATRELAAHTEKALQQQREFLEQAQQVAQIGSWIAELDGSERLTWSPEMYRILGRADGDLPTRSRSMEYVHPDDRDAVRNARRAAIATAQPFEVEHRIVRPDGTLRWVHTQAHLIRDHEGHPARMVGTLQDITRRRELEEELRQSQKLEAVGRLAGGVAHDLNNVLTVIIGYAELAENALGENDAVRKDVTEIMRAAERAEAVTRQLLAFSRKQWLEPRVFQLTDAALSLGRMLERLMGPTIELITIVDPNLPPIYGDRGQLEQAIVNLVLNASDATPLGGTVTIRVQAVDLDQVPGHIGEAMAPGKYLELSVQDTGHGMTAETRSHIFEPFFTTKEVGRGTGLGLAMVYGTVKQNGGFISVESEPGQGSIFRVYFPAAEALPPAEGDPSARPIPTQSATVLVVEDETAVRNLIVTTLSRDGFRVLQAESGPAALVVADSAGPIDLLVTDVTMPDMTGLELAATLAKVNADMRLIVMSGRPVDELDLQSLERPATLLAKPFTPSDLRQRIRTVLVDATDRRE